MYLAAAGVGTLGIVDFDTVDESNLQRQIIHGVSATSAGPRRESAAASHPRDQPVVNVVIHNTALDRDNVMEIFGQYDLIVDGTDNFATRYMVNDAAVLLGKPYVWGSIYRFDGQASVFWAEHGPCYRCLYPEPPPPGMVPSCAEGGVLGVLCASIGSIQVTEAIKLLTGIGEPLVGRLMVYDALEMAYRKIKVRKDPNCALCGENPTVTDLIEDYEDFCGAVSRGGAGGGARLDHHRARAQGLAGRRQGRLPGRRPRAGRVRDRHDPGRDADPQGRDPLRRGAGAAAAGPADRAALQVGRARRPRRSPRSRRPASRTPCTSRAASSPGSSRSTRRCPRTDRSARPGPVRLRRSAPADSGTMT